MNKEHALALKQHRIYKRIAKQIGCKVAAFDPGIKLILCDKFFSFGGLEWKMVVALIERLVAAEKVASSAPDSSKKIRWLQLKSNYNESINLTKKLDKLNKKRDHWITKFNYDNYVNTMKIRSRQLFKLNTEISRVQKRLYLLNKKIASGIFVEQ